MKNQSLAQLRDTYDCEALDELHNEFPVPVGKICSALGIKASHNEMPNNESGKIFLEDSKYYIQVNFKHIPTRRRFTIAHELGHYCLHKKLLEEQGQILERNDVSRAGIDEKEIQANSFAAELLMPRHEVLKQYNLLESIQQLAEYFFVSELAIQVRLVNLGINTKT